VTTLKVPLGFFANITVSSNENRYNNTGAPAVFFASWEVLSPL